MVKVLLLIVYVTMLKQRSYFDKALAIKPNFVTALFEKGSILYDQRNYVEATNYLIKRWL